jgi:hypothetical protein
MYPTSFLDRRSLQFAVALAIADGNLTAAYVYSRMLARHALNTVGVYDRPRVDLRAMPSTDAMRRLAAMLPDGRARL